METNGADGRMSWTRDGSLAWRAEGPHEPDAPGEPVLMIMGLGGSSRLWYRLLPWVARRHRAIVFDNRGTGISDPVRSILTMRDLADDALSVLDAAGEESAHVIGVSMGGMVAQHVALDDRERVRSLVLACTAAGGRRGAPPWRLLAASALRPLLGPSRTFPLVAPVLYAEATRRDRPERLREDLSRRIGDETPAMTIWAQMGAISGHDTRERLAELEGVPTLVVHGLDDSLVPPERGRELAQFIPGAHLELIRDCGHVLTTDAEEPTAIPVVEHFERNARVLV
jgi:pimeloyl-ACP methyl ester carboxylesterase